MHEYRAAAPAISTRSAASSMMSLHRSAREPSWTPVCAARGTRGEPARSRSREHSEAYAFAAGMQSRWDGMLTMSLALIVISRNVWRRLYRAADERFSLNR
jgi:hypothetical protein